MLAALMILRANESYLRDLVEYQNLNDSGLYFVRLWVDGVWRYTAVDDFVPCVRKSTQSGKVEPAFLELAAA